MKLNPQGLDNRKEWEEKAYILPSFSIEKMREDTLKAPTWLHFGAGNIFRAFPAVMQQHLLNTNQTDKGIIVCEGFDEELIEKAFLPYDNVSLSVVLKETKEIDKIVVASIAESYAVSKSQRELENFFENPSLQMVSFTITEKGYAVKDPTGQLLSYIKTDVESDPREAKTLIGQITALCFKRFEKGRYPLAFVSMDNCSHNGDKLKIAITTMAEEWTKKGYFSEEYLTYLKDEKSVSFPLSMIDKITPRPSEEVKAILEKDGVEDVTIIETAKHSFSSCFVNAEETGYLVIEDIFPNGRPALEKAGTIFTDRETVDKIEKMKVCTCLNPLHTALAIYGCLLDYSTIYSEMQNPVLKKLIEQIGYVEGLPVVIDPKIIDPKDFIDQVVGKRLPNPYMPDTPQRIAMDTSQKLPVRFGETLKAYLKKGDTVDGLTYIPLVFAGWLRYLLGVNDQGHPFEISPDPRLDEMKKHLEGISLGNIEGYQDKIQPILSDETIFGVNLYDCGLSGKVQTYFEELTASVGAVKNTLDKYVK